MRSLDELNQEAVDAIRHAIHVSKSLEHHLEDMAPWHGWPPPMEVQIIWAMQHQSDNALRDAQEGIMEEIGVEP